MKNGKLKFVKNISLILAVAGLSVFGYIQFARAAGATLYLSPASSSVQEGNNISVVVHVNTGGETVNAVQANISYPTDKLDFVSITSSSAFPFEVESSGGSGSVRIARGNASGVSGDQIVATVTFTAKTTLGSALVNFASGSSVVRASDSQDILSGTTGGAYTVTAPPSTPSPSPSPSPAPSPSPSPSSSPSSSPSGSTKTSTGTSTNPVTSPPATTGTSAAVQTDTVAPKISNIKVVNISFKSATITWTTSEPANSAVSYGTTASYGLNAIDGNYVTNHNVELPSDALAAGTQFNFIVKSVDPAGNTTTSDNGTFTTKGMSLQVKVVDGSSKAVKGVEVSLGSKSAKTDSKGQVVLTDLPAGKQQLKLKSGNKITMASVNILDNGNSKLQTTTVKITPGGSSILKVVVPIIVVLVILGAVAVFIVKRRGDGGIGGFGPMIRGGSGGKMVTPLGGPKTDSTGVIITPVGGAVPPQPAPAPTVTPSAPVIKPQTTRPPASEIKDPEPPKV